MDRTISRREIDLLRLARKTLGYTQQEWANQLGLGHGVTVARWENGTRVPSLGRIAHIKLVLQKPAHMARILASPEAAAELQRGGFI